MGGAVEYCPACGLGLPQFNPPPPGPVTDRVHDLLPARSPFEPHQFPSLERGSRPRPATAPLRNVPAYSSWGSTFLGMDLMAPFRSVQIRGTLIHMDPPYQAEPERKLLPTIFKAFSCLVFLPVVMLTYAAWSSMSWMMPGGSGQGSGFFGQFLNMLMMRRIFKPKDLETVRDFRLREETGAERLVRIRGDFVAGNVNTGDEVQIEGSNRSGTIIFRRGHNLRTNSQILVRKK